MQRKQDNDAKINLLCRKKKEFTLGLKLLSLEKAAGKINS